ncbi:unnamed protein product [Protopolystoma xenopodis]|uniref:Uncharacterized protein n=1 Tax=Protopolystoma xenopodis TaxID=117903 RepID=A0A3S5API9_9PLAT|nr:unnamed protein product [Protopolystoma xenopodis]
MEVNLPRDRPKARKTACPFPSKTEIQIILSSKVRHFGICAAGSAKDDDDDDDDDNEAVGGNDVTDTVECDQVKGCHRS